MKIGIFTSSRATSLQKVSNDIARTFNTLGVDTVIFKHTNVYEELFDLTGGIVVMPVDRSLCMNYMFLCYRLKSLAKPAVFYGTVEGDIKTDMKHDWVRREVDFVANSKYVSEKLQKAGYRVLKIIPHGVDTKFYNDASKYRKTIREKLRIGEDVFLIGYIASSHKRKGHNLASQVMKIIEKKDPSIKFLVISHPESASYYIGLRNIIFMQSFGKLSENTIKALYGAMDLYSHFSLSEGFGLPVLEALASGKLVAHPDYDPLSEITTPETSFRVPVKRIDYYTDFTSINFELHIYDPEEYAETLIQAKDFILKSPRGELEALAKKRAKLFNMYTLYPRLIHVLKEQIKLFI